MAVFDNQGLVVDLCRIIERQSQEIASMVRGASSTLLSEGPSDSARQIAAFQMQPVEPAPRQDVKVESGQDGFERRGSKRPHGACAFPSLEVSMAQLGTSGCHSG